MNVLLLLILGISIQIKTFETGIKVVVKPSKDKVYILRSTTYAIFGYQYPSLKLQWIIPNAKFPISVPRFWKIRYLPALSIHGTAIYNIDVIKGEIVDSFEVNFQNYNSASIEGEDNSWVINFGTNVNPTRSFSVLNIKNSKKLRPIVTRAGCFISNLTFQYGRYFAVCASGLSLQSPEENMLSDSHTGLVEIGINGRFTDRYLMEFMGYAYSPLLYLNPRDSILYYAMKVINYNPFKYRISTLVKFKVPGFKVLIMRTFNRTSFSEIKTTEMNGKFYVLAIDNIGDRLYIFDKNFNVLKTIKFNLEPIKEDDREISYNYYWMEIWKNKILYLFTDRKVLSYDPRSSNLSNKPVTCKVFTLDYPFDTPPKKVAEFKVFHSFSVAKLENRNEFIVFSNKPFRDKLIILKLNSEGK